jgi:hypothetical protein
MTDNNQVCHYLEAAPVDISSKVAWGADFINITGTSSLIGTGRKNTALILNQVSSAPAAQACKDYRGPNNLTDWFLPSTNELYQLYKSRVKVGNMGKGSYWSSSQDYSGTNHAWSQDFANGVQYYDDKNDGSYVRAVRGF